MSTLFAKTLREAPAEAEHESHRLMLRARIADQNSAGIYSYLPLGYRVLRKIEQIVREEQNRAGAIEMLMPTIQSAELWRESGRYDDYGKEMLRIKDRHEREMLYGPTNEEMITDVFRSYVRSYKDLPLNLYHIQWKFRDEVRPRFGLMRGREFLMKDAYSFHADQESLEQTYRAMIDCYSRIFTRLGLKFRAVAADTGAIGGTGSHEFHVLADSGEDAIAYCPGSGYAANVELAEAVAPATPRGKPAAALARVHTPGAKTIVELCAFLRIPAERTVKAVVLVGADDRPVLLMVRGDHELNLTKAAKLEQVKKPVAFAPAETIRSRFGAGPGSLGPVGFEGVVIADRTVVAMSDFVVGANEDGQHYTGVNIGRDFPEPVVADVRNVVAGDTSPDGKGRLEILRGIEVGHVFQLRNKYSKALNLSFLDEAGKSRFMEMGCYGIGVTRIVAAAIEQNYDDRGIIFPRAMAPFELALVPIGAGKSAAVRETAEALYRDLAAAGIDVLLDDRGERPGVAFADMELIGIPHRVVVGERGLKNGQVEYQGRRDPQAQSIALQDAVKSVKSKVCTD
jgi:prolyl-tRNA synthetase